MNIKNNKNCKITINDEGIAVSEKEKTADEMFEELGYSISDGIENFYTNVLIAGKKQKDISFDDVAKDFITIYLTKYNEYGNLETNQIVLSVKELQAINKKVRELRLDMMNKCKYITIRTKNYEKYFYCRLNKKIINYTTECIKCIKNEPRKNKSVNKVSKKRITVTKETYDKVIERDDYKCRLSGINCNGALELHHIKYRSEAKKLINEPNNCIMLCNVHHRLVHSNKHYWQPKLLEMNKGENKNGKL